MPHRSPRPCPRGSRRDEPRESDRAVCRSPDSRQTKRAQPRSRCPLGTHPASAMRPHGRRPRCSREQPRADSGGALQTPRLMRRAENTGGPAEMSSRAAFADIMPLAPSRAFSVYVPAVRPSVASNLPSVLVASRTATNSTLKIRSSSGLKGISQPPTACAL